MMYEKTSPLMIACMPLKFIDVVLIVSLLLNGIFPFKVGPLMRKFG